MHGALATLHHFPDLKISNCTYMSPSAHLLCKADMEGETESRTRDELCGSQTGLMEEMSFVFLHKRATAYFCAHARSSSVMRKDSVR
jgi:hypothetical protein